MVNIVQYVKTLPTFIVFLATLCTSIGEREQANLQNRPIFLYTYIIIFVSNGWLGAAHTVILYAHPNFTLP